MKKILILLLLVIVAFQITNGQPALLKLDRFGIKEGVRDNLVAFLKQDDL